MEVRAAVAFEAGKPLDGHQGQARRPQGRRGPGRNQGDRRLSYRRIHPLGRRPRGAFSGDSGTRGRGHRRRDRRRRDLAEKRRPRHSALHPRVPRMRILPLAQDQSLPEDPRHPRRRRHARRHLALLARWQENPPLHGHVDLFQFHRGAGNSAGQDPRGRAFRQGLLHRLRRHHRPRRRDQHRQGRGRHALRRLRPRRHRIERRSRACASSAPR